MNGIPTRKKLAEMKGIPADSVFLRAGYFACK